jgi:hypothetical protein
VLPEVEQCRGGKDSWKKKDSYSLESAPKEENLKSVCSKRKKEEGEDGGGSILSKKGKLDYENNISLEEALAVVGSQPRRSP